MPERERRTVVIAGTGFQSLETERSYLGSIGVEVIDASGLPRAEAAARCRAADGLMVDYFRCDRKLISQLERCRVICQYGVGLDQIDVDAASDAGIVVTHTPAYCVDELADHTLALLLAVARRIVLYDHLVRSGRWEYMAGLPIRRLSGKTLGLVGFGRVGQAVARRAHGFGMRVIAHDPLVEFEIFEALGVEPVNLATLLETSDIISVHVPLSAETRHLIGATELERMREGTILVNTARGAILDQRALIDVVVSGQLMGAGLDVLEEEPPPSTEPLLKSQNVVLTPHAGFLSIESLDAVQRQASEEVRRVLLGERPLFGVNTDEALAASAKGREKNR